MKSTPSNRPHAEMGAAAIQNAERDILRREKSTAPVKRVQSFKEFRARKAAGFAAPLAGTDAERDAADAAWEVHKAENSLEFP